MFEQACRAKLRFDTTKGQLSVEDLWDLPLTTTTSRVNLDDILKGLNRQLRESSETLSYVNRVVEPKNEELQLKFDVVKHIIDVLMVERDKNTEAAKRRAMKQRILEIVASKEDEALRGKSIDDLKTMAESL